MFIPEHSYLGGQDNHVAFSDQTVQWAPAFTCLSPLSAEPAAGLLDAAAKCGARGEMLLDFLPYSQYIPGLFANVSQPTVMLGDTRTRQVINSMLRYIFYTDLTRTWKGV